MRTTRYHGLRWRIAGFCAFAATMGVILGAPSPIAAQVSCPSPNPVVHENNCQGAGSDGWRLSNHSESLGGYATRGSFDKGDNVPLKIARNVAASSTAVDIRVYRMGWYGGLGGRLVHTRLGATVNNTLACNAMDPTTGKLDCGNWSTTYTIPAASLPASGVYLVKLTATAPSRIATVR